VRDADRLELGRWKFELSGADLLFLLLGLQVEIRRESEAVRIRYVPVAP